MLRVGEMGFDSNKKSCKNHTYERDRKEREVFFLY